MRKSLTDTFLRALEKPDSGRLEYADQACRGLEFRLTKAGTRSWSFRYRAPVTGKLSRATIGPYPTVSLADARLKADGLRRLVADGENPSEAKRQAKRDAPGRTFQALADRYLTECAKRSYGKRSGPKRSADEEERNLRLHILPKWADRDYGAIRRRDVIELIEGLIAAGKPVMANRVQSLVSVVFSFAADSDLIDANPCTRLKKRGAEEAGQRVLSDPEIKLFWSGVVKTPISRQTGLGLRLALLTGVRIGEVAGLMPTEFEALDDVDKAIWRIPATRTKNGHTLVLPLAGEAISIAREIVPVTAHAYAKAMNRFAGDLEGTDAAVRNWKHEPPTPHDLRRTVRTRLPQLGVTREVCDRIMNHAPTDVGGRHYDRYSYLDEKRRALALWSDQVASIVDAS